MLRSESFMVPRSYVASLLRELDPNGGKKEEFIDLNDVYILIQGLTFVGTWMGMINLSHLAFPSMVTSMGSAAK